jgi:hypothetical protein
MGRDSLNKERNPHDSTARRSNLRDNLVRGCNPKDIYPFLLMTKGER